ncbi:guanyl-nucleotide exchange factor [Ophiostoma piceae UAMH 11346]|uniref:Guanyl-nucleotide exchange factor n=1 Tax=Ophiostoma piceae (strain UAMH 11346) TaxID=1262450 RepID=S3CCP5_OPHP1|nr:guanyl-nucleotide exchange factor [Ophiostoma piceae UAMH 11346]
MPFLRRRGVMASESDMRRHTAFFNPLAASKLPQQPEQELPQQLPPSMQPRPSGQHDQYSLYDQHDQHDRISVYEQPGSSAPQLSSPVLPEPSVGAETSLGAAVTAAGNSAAKQPLALAPVQILPTNIVVHQPSPSTPTADDAFSGNHNITRGVVSIDSSCLRPESPPIQDETPKHRRFSILRFRNASDSQLAARARQHAQAEANAAPPIPSPPEIIMTAPTFEFGHAPQRKQSRVKLPSLSRKSSELPRIPDQEEPVGRTSSTFGSWARRDRRKSIIGPVKPNIKNPAVAFDEAAISEQQQRSSTSISQTAPPEYGDDVNSALALPVNRLSESSRSDASSGDRVYGTTTTTTHTVSTTTTFFRLPRRRKGSNPPSLFPIGHLPQKGQTATPIDSSISEDGPATNTTSPRAPSRGIGAFGRGGLGADNQETPTQSRPVSQRRGITTPPGLAPSPAMALFQKGNPSPASAFFRPSSRNSGQSSPTRSIPGGPSVLGRGRSSTLSSIGRESVGGGRESTDDRLTPPALRTSSSATGRKSFSDLLGLSRLRQNSEPNRHGAITPVTPGSSTSKNNSLQIARDSFVMPERREDDTPAKYLARLEEVVSRSVIASALSKSNDAFSQSVLRSYMRTFKFFGDPMDMAIRKLLMEAELPRETQQIDRFLESFANRYHECNPGIFLSPDQAYFIAFSLLILHTDVFNKNNKHKMQRADYQKNTRGEGIFDEILEVFYDNISYTPFIHVEDDFDINGERIVAHKTKRKSIFPNTNPDLVKKSAKEPIDPYTLIIDNNLDLLRPNLKDLMQLEDTYGYLGTVNSLNMKELQKTFFRTGILQIVSARSRPDAFMTEKTAVNPQEAHPGIVDIKITKVGLLWRKDTKKKKTRSPWQEWGAILTGAQLYFFRNTSWVKNLIHQYETHIRHGHDDIPIIFKPPLEEFKPDALMSTNGAVALLDSSYKRHKHAFTYVRPGNAEEVLLADNEEEMNDWLAKLNYAAAFRTSGVRMRGVVGGLYEGQDRRAIRHLGTDETQSVQTPTGEVMITRSRIDQKMAHDILIARRDIMAQKMEDANAKLEEEEKKLELQLRNARHLQIMAPIQPKTRDQMYTSATRMDEQIKWSRIEMWRLKCHRDILQMDLEDEKHPNIDPEHALESGAAIAGIVGASAVAAGMAVSGGASSSSPDKRASQQQQPHLQREQSKASSANTVLPRSPQSAAHRGSLAGISVGSGGANGTSTSLVAPESPATDVFQTPPTSATGANLFQHKHHSSSDVVSNGFDFASLRKASVSSAISSGPSVSATPPRAGRSLSSAHEHGHSNAASTDDTKPQEHDPNDFDAEEYDLLQKTGLLRSVHSRTSVTSSDKNKHSSVSEDVYTTQAEGSKPQAGQDGPQTPLDRNKIRRSLQRTLREGAGHLSTRGRKPREGAVVGALEDGNDEPTTLERGTGSFVVHGKKASVITFGGDFSAIIPRKQQAQSSQQLSQAAGDASTLMAVSPMGLDDASLISPTEGTTSGVTDNNLFSFNSDYRAAIFQERERRESATSASTATARSFRDLHRKYSSVRATSRSSTVGKGLVSDDDDESEAAVSNSDGRHTPLVQTGDDAASEKNNKRKKYLSGVGEASGGEEPAAGRAGDGDDDHDANDTNEATGVEDGNDKKVEEAGDVDEEADADGLRSASTSSAQAQFYTPDPPATPTVVVSEAGADESVEDAEASSNLGGRPLHAVHAVQA